MDYNDHKTRRDRMGRSYFMEGLVDVVWFAGIGFVGIALGHIVYRFTLWNPPVEEVGTLIHNLIS